MPCYKLQLKPLFVNKYFKIKGLVEHTAGDDSENHQLFKKGTQADELSLTYVVDADHTRGLFTREEIYALPRRLTMMHNVVMAEEPLYFIKIPYVNAHEDNYINRGIESGPTEGKTVIYNKLGVGGFRTKFTRAEVELFYPLFANDSFMVPVEEACPSSSEVANNEK